MTSKQLTSNHWLLPVGVNWRPDGFNALKSKFSKFIHHTFVKREQAAWLESSKGLCDWKSTGGFFGKCGDTSSLFTAHVWITEELNSSMVIVSQHTKHGIFVYMQPKAPLEISRESVYSVTAHITNSKQFSFPTYDHGVRIQWNFFATSHGKGVVDGICLERSSFREKPCFHSWWICSSC